MIFINKLLAKLDLAIVKRSRITRAESALPFIDNSTLNIAVSITGGIGDAIISLGWIKELCKQVPCEIKFDIYGREKNLKFLTRDNSFVHGVYPNMFFHKAAGYDLKLRIFHHVNILESCNFSINKKCPELITILDKIFDFSAKYEKYITAPPPLHWGWTEICKFNGWNRWDELGANQGISFSRKNKAAFFLSSKDLTILDKLGLNKRQYITIHRGMDNYTPKNARSSSVKIWPKANSEAFCRMFKKKYPDILIVQIGADSPLALEEVDLCMVSKTTLEEAAVILKHSLVHLDGESGMVHLRRQLGAESVVLFGPTPAHYFAYDENINIISAFCTDCIWKHDNMSWFEHCIKGFDGPKCLEEINPQTVLEAVTSLIEKQKAYGYVTSNTLTYSTNKDLYKTVLDDICQSNNLEKNHFQKSLLENLASSSGDSSGNSSGDSFGTLPNSLANDLSDKPYDKANSLTTPEQWEYAYYSDFINKVNKQNLKIANIGVNDWVLPSYLASKGHNITVFASSLTYHGNGHGNGNDNIKEIKQSAPKLSNDKKINLEFANALNLPADDNTFDILTFKFIEKNITEQYYALKEMLRILKPGGHLILTYNMQKDSYINNYLQKQFTDQNILDFLTAMYQQNNLTTKTAEETKHKSNPSSKKILYGTVISKQEIN